MLDNMQRGESGGKLNPSPSGSKNSVSSPPYDPLLWQRQVAADDFYPMNIQFGEDIFRLRKLSFAAVDRITSGILLSSMALP